MEKDIKTNKGATSRKGAEPKPGEGVRSLETWKKLASARAALATEQGGRQQLASDPAAYFKRFGLEDLGPSADAAQLRELEDQLGVDPLGDLQVDARRGAVAVVGPVVLAVAYNKVGAAQVGGVVNVGVNLNVAKNWNETCGCGRP